MHRTLLWRGHIPRLLLVQSGAIARKVRNRGPDSSVLHMAQLVPAEEGEGAKLDRWTPSKLTASVPRGQRLAAPEMNLRMPSDSIAEDSRP